MIGKAWFWFQGSEFRVLGSGFRVLGSGCWVHSWFRFRVQNVGFRVSGSGFWVRGSGFWGLGSSFWVLGSGIWVHSGFRVSGSGFRVSGFWVPHADAGHLRTLDQRVPPAPRSNQFLRSKSNPKSRYLVPLGPRTERAEANLSDVGPLGPVGLYCAQHRRTPRPSVERIRTKAKLPFGI